MLQRSLFFILSAILFAMPALACTDFMIIAKDKTLINGRTMDFGILDEAKVTVYPKGKKWKSSDYGNIQGFQWKQTIGFVGFSVFGKEASSEGMNEAGLTAKALWLPSAEDFQGKPNKNSKNIIEAILIPDWILGNFTTVADVKKQLPNLFVWANKLPQLGGLPTLHVAVHDLDGNNLVAEWVDGKLNMYDNPLGVMTNEPPFPMQLSNLRNYVNLSPWVQKDLVLRGEHISGTGNGSGLLGLPGDCTPPSRFVRTAIWQQFAYQPSNKNEAINLARHLLDKVSVIKGTSRKIIIENNKKTEVADYTQWSSIEDMTNRVIYFSNYYDQTLQSIDLKKIDFTRSDYKPISVMHISGNAIKDVTPR